LHAGNVDFEGMYCTKIVRGKSAKDELNKKHLLIFFYFYVEFVWVFDKLSWHPWGSKYEKIKEKTIFIYAFLVPHGARNARKTHKSKDFYKLS